MPGTDLALLIEAARDAGAIALRHFGQNPDYTDKPGGAGPVSEADIAVDDALREALLDARPDYGWLSEETPDSAHRRETARQFIVDPIDGTRAFLGNNPDWALSLAVTDRGEASAAVVFLPARDLLFAAALGEGATLNGETIRPTDADLEGARVLAAKPAFAPGHWKGGMLPPVERVFRSSLAYRMCLVAQGRFDAMLTLRPAWEWDIAAGTLICAEAGACATDPARGRLSFNNPRPKLSGVLAAGPRLHAALADRLEPPRPSG